MALKKRIRHHDERFNKVVYGTKGNNIITESYNRLKDNVLFFNLDNTIKVIEVTSAVASEGKTTTLVNLAVSLALNGKKVIVVDADLRSPRAHRTLNATNDFGIQNFMLDTMTIDQIIQKTEYNVDFISRGERITNSSAVVSSEKFKNLITSLRDKYDYVLIDCPPVLVISDYIQISTVTDGSIFCVAYGTTKKAQVKEAVHLLKQSNINVLGAVYTFVDEKIESKYGYGYGHYGHYGHYGSYYGHYYGQNNEENEEQETETKK